MRVEESRPLLVSASDSAPINIGEGDGPGSLSDQGRRVDRRLASIDLLRGAIVIIMVRVLSALARMTMRRSKQRERERERCQHVTKAVKGGGSKSHPSFSLERFSLVLFIRNTIPLNMERYAYVCRY
jgi:hypothetical protein